MQGLARQVQSRGRGNDTMLVHMTPREVGGLQALAKAHGGSLTTNPDTGLPEAGFLDSVLPMLAGAALGPLTGGLINPVTAGLLVGAGTGLATGDLGKGVMAGLGAWGGASIGNELGLGPNSLGLQGSFPGTTAPVAKGVAPSLSSAVGAAADAAPPAAPRAYGNPDMGGASEWSPTGGPALGTTATSATRLPVAPTVKTPTLATPLEVAKATKDAGGLGGLKQYLPYAAVAAPFLLDTGNGVPKYDPTKTGDTSTPYKGPYTFAPRKFIPKENPLDSSEHVYFDTVTPRPNFAPGGVVALADGGSFSAASDLFKSAAKATPSELAALVRGLGDLYNAKNPPPLPAADPMDTREKDFGFKRADPMPLLTNPTADENVGGGGGFGSFDNTNATGGGGIPGGGLGDAGQGVDAGNGFISPSGNGTDFAFFNGGYGDNGSFVDAGSLPSSNYNGGSRRSSSRDPNDPTNLQLLTAAGNVAGLVLPPVGLASSALNFGQGVGQGINRAAYYEDPQANPTLLGSQTLGDMLYGKGLAGTGGDALGWLIGKGMEAFDMNHIDPTVLGPEPEGMSYSPSNVAPTVMGPTPSGEPYKADPNSPGLGSALAAYGQPGAYNLSGQRIPVTQLDPNDPYQNAVMAGTTLGQVGGSGNSDTGTPWGLGGQTQDIGGAGVFNSIGLAPWMTGDMGGGYTPGPNDPLTQASWFSPGFGAVDRNTNPNDTNAKGGVNLRDGSFVVDARTVSELGNGSSSAGQDLLAQLGGHAIHGPGDGVSDSISANIDGAQEARVARDEVKFDPETVARLGGGDAKKGADKLYDLMNKARKARKKAERGEDTGLRSLVGVQ